MRWAGTLLLSLVVASCGNTSNKKSGGGDTNDQNRYANRDARSYGGSTGCNQFGNDQYSGNQYGGSQYTNDPYGNGGTSTYGLVGESVQQIFQMSCVSCHSASNRHGNVALDTYDGASVSARLSLAAVQNGSMPPQGQGTPLTQEHQATLQNWINTGATSQGFSQSGNSTGTLGSNPYGTGTTFESQTSGSNCYGSGQNNYGGNNSVYSNTQDPYYSGSNTNTGANTYN